jgi:excisionase family DNA binding protein
MSKDNVARFYTKQEVAEMLKVSVRTITRYMSCGLPYKKIGGTVRIPEDKLINWLGGR